MFYFRKNIQLDYFQGKIQKFQIFLILYNEVDAFSWATLMNKIICFYRRIINLLGKELKTLKQTIHYLSR